MIFFLFIILVFFVFKYSLLELKKLKKMVYLWLIFCFLKVGIAVWANSILAMKEKKNIKKYTLQYIPHDKLKFISYLIFDYYMNIRSLHRQFLRLGISNTEFYYQIKNSFCQLPVIFNLPYHTRFITYFKILIIYVILES